MNRHGNTACSLHKALAAKSASIDRTTIKAWRTNAKGPGTTATLKAVDLIEARYQLPPGYLRSRIGPGRAVSGHSLPYLSPSERRRLAWHLPDDFGRRSRAEQAAIVDWVQANVLSGGTAYHRYHAAISRHRFAFRFDHLLESGRRSVTTPKIQPEFVPPARLEAEMADLLRFKTRTLTEVGFQRSGVWGVETASQKLEHLGLFFGALAAPRDSITAGHGVARDRLSFALLISPTVWDWYVQWRETRRGFFTGWEAEMLLLAAALTRKETGWLRQREGLAAGLEPVEGLITAQDVERIQADWDGACETVHRHSLARAKEIQRVARVHRDPFEPLLPVLAQATGARR